MQQVSLLVVILNGHRIFHNFVFINELHIIICAISYFSIRVASVVSNFQNQVEYQGSQNFRRSESDILTEMADEVTADEVRG